MIRSQPHSTFFSLCSIALLLLYFHFRLLFNGFSSSLCCFPHCHHHRHRLSVQSASKCAHHPPKTKLGKTISRKVGIYAQLGAGSNPFDTIFDTWFRISSALLLSLRLLLLLLHCCGGAVVVQHQSLNQCLASSCILAKLFSHANASRRHVPNDHNDDDEADNDDDALF